LIQFTLERVSINSLFVLMHPCLLTVQLFYDDLAVQHLHVCPAERGQVFEG